MQPMRVALATSARWPELAPEDSSLIPELTERGIEARAVVWSDPSVDWSGFDRVVIRSCWDYHRRIDEFLKWIDRVPSLRNPAPVVRWNSHKSYLMALEETGVQIPHTILLAKGTRDDGLDMTGRVILKPAISASAYETHLFASLDAARSEIARLVTGHDVVVQEFVPEVVEKGEWSLMFFDRHFSHAVLKAPRTGDFRVQNEHGGSALPARPSSDLLRTAAGALNAVEGDLSYARVDLVETARGALLMELELIEPSLFLTSDGDATRRFVDAVMR